MKISGNKKDARYATGGARRKISPDGRTQAVKNEKSGAARTAVKKRKPNKAVKIILIILVVILALAAVLFCVYKFAVKPPPPVPKPPGVSPTPSESAINSGSSAGPTISPSGEPDPETDRKSSLMRTFVILGFDDGNGNTDTMMVVNFDAVNYKMNVVNIPRDTLVNVSWYTKKANSLYAGNGGIDGVIDGLRDILGFNVDFYVVVDLDAFAALVDAVDGVDFDVPPGMHYSDPAQDLYINLSPGMQNLNGSEALQLVRFRSGYATGDIGRIDMQQKFLMAMCQQVIEKQKNLDLYEIADIFIKYVKTNLTAGNLVWLGQEFYKMDAENITFQTLPANYNDSVHGNSYVTIHVNDWLKLLNEKINPFREDITLDELSIYTRDANGNLYVTDGNYAGNSSWGKGSSASSSASTSSSPSPSPSPSPSADTSASPSADATASPSDGASPSPSADASPSPSADASPSPGTSPSPDTSPNPSASPSADPSTSPSADASPSSDASPSPSTSPDDTGSSGTDITDG